ncbi:MAG: tRNA dihydrouridine synthase DusB [Bacteroidia bacterium]
MVKIGDIALGDFPLLLAPMEDVSDPPFRFVCKQQGVDLMYTEFISSEGLIRDAAKSVQKLDIFEYERPIGIQIFGSEIESMVEATKIATLAKPDLIDINYGCPVKKVACKGAGAGILTNPEKMVAMTKAIVEATHLPVTVKTRLGWDEKTKNIVEVAERLQDVGIQALSIHGRTRVQLYKGDADWTLIGEVKNNPRMRIPIFGNGDIDGPEKALEYKNRFGVDGLMIGRASIGYPWVFREIKHYLNTGERLPGPSFEERLKACKIHHRKSLECKGHNLGLIEMRRHYANYFKGLPDFKEYRTRLVQSMDAQEVDEILKEVNTQYAELTWMDS